MFLCGQKADGQVAREAKWNRWKTEGNENIGGGGYGGEVAEMACTVGPGSAVPQMWLLGCLSVTDN